MDNKSDDSGLLKSLKALGLLGGIGIFFAVVIAICIFIGNLADEWLVYDYAGKLTGIILGFPIAFYLTYRQLKEII
ncbi:AtpZ/AtpI family protein [Anaerovibrio sp.]|uniref:AtpZ/AtpI family protein n=1 Tax=Anaerovibrio sp. TaxID=1872532 RepID=UPI0025C3F731|nr:AtpZ/AtpI family protein [Anaerovibrio sp.]MBR2142432.1 AtpZ/AtpI family protein [Anaerovibrio sp.]